MTNNSSTVLFLLRKVDCDDGISSYCQSVAQALKARGVNVFMVSGPIDRKSYTAVRHEGLTSNLFGWTVIDGLKQFPTLGAIVKIFKIIRENKISVVNVHGLGMNFMGKVNFYNFRRSSYSDLPSICSGRSFKYLSKISARVFTTSKNHSSDVLSKQYHCSLGRVTQIS